MLPRLITDNYKLWEMYMVTNTASEQLVNLVQQVWIDHIGSRHAGTSVLTVLMHRVRDAL